MELLPDAGHFALCNYNSASWLVDRRTGEAVVFAEPHHLFEDPGGFALIAPAGSNANAAYCSETTHWNVYDAGGRRGEQLVRKRPCGTENVAQLAAARDQFSRRLVRLKPTVLDSWTQHNCAVGSIPRCGQRVWWHLQDIHTICGLSVFKDRQSSVWAHCMYKQLFQGLSKMSLGHQIEKGIATSSSELGAESSRVLDRPSVSTIGLLAIVSRWGHGRQGRGRMVDDDDAGRCASYLEALVGAAVGDSFHVPLDLGAKTFVWNPPLPPTSKALFRLVVGCNGVVDIRPLVAAAKAKNADAEKLSDDIHKLVPACHHQRNSNGRNPTLLEFIQVLAHNDRWNYNLLAQVLHMVGVILDTKIAPVRFFHDDDLLVSINDSLKLERRVEASKRTEVRLAHSTCADYVMTTREICMEESESSPTVSCSFDITRIGGQAMLIMFVAFSSNLAFWCVPVAPSSKHWGRKWGPKPPPGAMNSRRNPRVSYGPKGPLLL